MNTFTKQLTNKATEGLSPYTRLNWALAIYPDAKIVLADSGRNTLVGVNFEGENHFLFETDESELERIIDSLDRKAGIINYKVKRWMKAAPMAGVKVVITDIIANRPGGGYRLYWRIPTPDAPGGYMDVMWTDCGHDSALETADEALARLLNLNGIKLKDCIDNRR